MRNRTKTIRFRHPVAGPTQAKLSERAGVIEVEVFGGEQSYYLISSASQSGKIAGLFAHACVDCAKIPHEHHVEDLRNHGKVTLVNKFCDFVGCKPLAGVIYPILLDWMQSS